MDLDIKDLAELLSVSEDTVQEWLEEGKIPFYLLNEEHRFSRVEIENWILHCQNLESPAVSSRGTQHFCLYRALHQGDVLTDIEGSTKEELIRSAAEIIAPKLNLDKEVLSELLLDREKMMPTGLNHGLAVPHVRDFLRKGPFDRVFVVYPKMPLIYGSLDGEPVHTLFFLFASHDRGHLQLLAKLSHLGLQPQALALLKQKPLKKELLDFVRQWENAI
jgi:PTS system nitrogen regulatory IIA component